LTQTEVLISLDQGDVLTNVQLTAESPPDSELVLSPVRGSPIINSGAVIVCGRAEYATDW